MYNKKIILATSSQTIDSSIFNLVSNCISGENIHLTLCVFKELSHRNTTVTNLNRLTDLCNEKAIILRLRILKSNEARKLQKLSLFADLLIIHQSLIQKADFTADFGIHSCPVMVLPNMYESINHVLLTLDGSPKSVASIKQFAQLFPNKLRNTDVTLVFFMDTDFEAGDEMLLIEYLKQFCEKLGVLKILKPISAQKLKPLKCDNHTLVLNVSGSLISDYQNCSLLPSLKSKKSVIFLPADA